MASPTEKTLNALLSSTLRIEKMMEKSDKKGSDGGGGEVEKLVASSNEYFLNMSKSLETIEGESKRTNELLSELIKGVDMENEAALGEISQTSEAIGKIGSGFEKLMDAIEMAGDLDDTAIDNFKKIIMTMAFLDWKTGKPLVEEKQLDKAAEIIGSIKAVVNSIIILGVAMVIFSFMLPQMAKGVLGVVLIVATLTISLILMQKALDLTGSEKSKDISGPIKSLKHLAMAVLMFGLVMAGLSFIVPQIFAGVLPFLAVLAMVGLALVMMDMVFRGEGGIRDTSPVGTLMKLGKAMILFSLILVGLSFLASPIAQGALVFIMVVAAIMLALLAVWAINKMADWNPMKDTSPIGTLYKLAKAVVFFSLTFILISFATKQFAMGALVFMLVLGAIMISLALLTRLLKGSSINPIKDKSPIGDLYKLSKGVAIFSLIFIGVGYFMKQFAMGALAVILALTGLTVPLLIMGTGIVKKGIRNMRKLAISTLLIVGAFFAWATLVQPKLTWEGLAMFGAAVGGMALIATILGAPPIDGWAKTGAMSLIALAGALIIFAGGLAIYAQLAAPKLTWENLAMLGAVIVIMALVGTLIGIPPISGFVLSGAIALIALGGALIVFAMGLSIYAQLAAPKLKMKDIGILGGIIGVMALVGTVLGIPVIFPFVMLGAVALIALGAALIPFTLGLSIFAASGFTSKDSATLNSALRYTIAGFLGYESLDDVGMGALAWVPMMSGLLLMSSAAMIFASLALLPISMALSVFKKTKWTGKDTANLNAAIYGVAQGFVNGLDGVDWWDLYMGVNSLKNVGRALTGLAEGVQAFANLTFTEYEYNQEKGEMVPVRKIKLTPKDIAMTGVAIGMVISAVTKPLAVFGEQMTGGGGGGFLGVNWGKMIAISFGINSLSSIGKGLVNMAQGVQDWANMTVTEYDVMTNPETGMPEIVPVAKRPITNQEIKSAMINISDMLSALSKPLADFGEVFTSEQKGWFGSTYQVENKGLKLGIKSMAQIGSGLVNMADGVVNWSKMQYVEYEIMTNPETGMPEIVPKSIKPISKAQISSAMYNIGSVLSALVKPLSDFGAMFTTTQKGWFGSTYQVENKGLITGIDKMGDIASNLTTMSEAVVAWASLSYTEFEVKKMKDGSSKLVPKKVHKITPVHISMAAFNIGMVLSVMARAVSNFYHQMKREGIWYTIDFVLKDMGNIIKGLGKVRTALLPWATGKTIRGAVFFNVWSKWLANAKHVKVVSTFAYAFPKGADTADGLKRVENTITTLSKIRNFVYAFFLDKNALQSAINYRMWTYIMADPMIVKMGKHYLMFGKYILLFDKAFAKFNKRPKMLAFGYMAKTLVILSKHANRFEKFVTAFERFSVAMGTFGKNFNLMTPDGIKAYMVWTNALVKASEIADKNNLGGALLDTAQTVIDTGFKVGEALFGSDEKESKLTDETKKSIIDKTNDATKDEAMDKMVEAIAGLKSEIAGLKSAMTGTMDVNVTSVATTATIKTQPG